MVSDRTWRARTAVRVALAGIRERALRVQPSSLSRPTQAVTVALWSTFVVGAVVVLAQAGPDGSSLGRSPAGFALVVLLLLPVFVATVVSRALTPRQDHPARSRALLALLGVASLLPARALLADGALGHAAAALGTAIVGLVLAVLCRRREPRQLLAITAGIATWLGWPIALLRGGAAPLGSSAWLLVLVAAFPIFVLTVTFGVAEAAENRFGRGALRSRPSWTTRAVALALVLKCLFLAWRLTAGRGIFGAGDARLWSLRSWTSWPHAVLVAALFVILVRASTRQPLRSRGSATVTAVLALGAASVAVAVLGDQLISILWVPGPLVGVSDGLAELGEVSVPLATNEPLFRVSNWLALAAVVLLAGVLVVARRFRRSTGRRQAGSPLSTSSHR